MMKKYKVEMFSEGLDAEMNVTTLEEAMKIYCRMRDSEIYDRGHLMSNETGEVLMVFFPNTITVMTEWVAF